MPNPIGQQAAAGSMSVVQATGPANPKYGQKAIAVTSTAVQIPSGSVPLVNGLVIQALSTNGGSVWVGDFNVTTGNGFELQPGQSVALSVANANAMFVNGTAGDGVCWMGN